MPNPFSSRGAGSAAGEGRVGTTVMSPGPASASSSTTTLTAAAVPATTTAGALSATPATTPTTTTSPKRPSCSSAVLDQDNRANKLHSLEPARKRRKSALIDSQTPVYLSVPHIPPASPSLQTRSPPSPASVANSGDMPTPSPATSTHLRRRGSAGNGNQLQQQQEDTLNRQRVNIRLSDDPAFDLIVVGCGGGPCEDNLSAYFVKSRSERWESGFAGIEGGSGLGAVRNLLLEKGLGPFYDFEPPSCTPLTPSATVHARPRPKGHSCSDPGARPLDPHHHDSGSPLDAMAMAGQIYKSLQSFCITHAHYDHISSLVLGAGALLKPKQVWGSTQTLKTISGAFNGGLWPRLGSFKEGERPLWFRTLLAKEQARVGQSLSLYMMPLAHGANPADESDLSLDPYLSSAFFFQDEPTGRMFLFFGDVGPDSVSGLELNRRVWEEAAGHIKVGRLSTIFIECSYPSSRAQQVLYGHLSPPFLFEELHILASYLPAPPPFCAGPTESGPLSGVNVVIIHVKDDAWPTTDFAPPPTPHPLGPGKSPTSQHMRDWIRLEIAELEGRHRLGCRFIITEQGDRFEL